MAADIGEIIRDRREALGLGQRELSERVGVTERQIGRYESGAQEPAASTCRLLARALHLSFAQLFGEVPIGLDLSGQWYAAWETSRGGTPVIDRHGLVVSHAGDHVVCTADGDYLWSGDLRIVDGSLMGTYRSTEAARQFRGSLYFTLADDTTAAVGRWTGLWADGLLGSGWGAIARDEDRAGRLLDTLINHNGPVTTWPQEG
ncbi:helix-turn-helix transcriptional regulator [Nocardia farcinica]|uniref:Putative DNA-binding protein n=1 Tax=Nocardia farcinica (strain IFM 10152) TaxID=247156 RepID=Q5Z3T1_NOCFA|nr:helix-turn-helix transcriptional regulator [Nocardia farcinica]BAD54910.1 putative DNA-binding protein [Nocardia farcinica IFM 10152]